VESILIKYEWRATLCSKRLIPCGTTYGQTRNRLWDDYGFAPRRPRGRELEKIEIAQRTIKGQGRMRHCIQTISTT